MTTTESDNDIMNKINSLKNEYYSENKKNLLFKNSQKFDCATTIVQNMNKNDLFNCIIQIDRNNLVFNYTTFKTIMHPGIYADLAHYIFYMNEQILVNHSTYNVIVDIKGLTMTGVERYKDFITVVSLEGQKAKKNFLQKLGKVHIINPPFMVANISKIILPLLDPVIKDRIFIM